MRGARCRLHRVSQDDSTRSRSVRDREVLVAPLAVVILPGGLIMEERRRNACGGSVKTLIRSFVADRPFVRPIFEYADKSECQIKRCQDERERDQVSCAEVDTVVPGHPVYVYAGQIAAA